MTEDEGAEAEAPDPDADIDMEIREDLVAQVAERDPELARK
ncbi:hypothetical protein ACFQH2_13450 [Natronoarchaeum sp. GCM10025703]